MNTLQTLATMEKKYSDLALQWLNLQADADMIDAEMSELELAIKAHTGVPVKDNRGTNRLGDYTPLDVRVSKPLWGTNTTGYRGVSFIKGKGKYRGAITYRGVGHHLGYFDTAIQAYCAYLMFIDEKIIEEASTELVA